MRRANRLVLILGAGLAASFPASAAAGASVARTATQALAEPVGHSTSISPKVAKLVVDLSDGSQVSIAFSAGAVLINGDSAAAYAAGGPLEHAWRALLVRAGSLSTPQVVLALGALQAPQLGPEAPAVAAAITAALPAVKPKAPAPIPSLRDLMAGPEINFDSLNRSQPEGARPEGQPNRPVRVIPVASFTGPRLALGRLATDVASLFGALVALASLGFGALFFVPHRLEVVAETVRRMPVRSFFAGLFAQPLLLPALVTMVIGLVLTIVGILVVPVAVVAFALAVAAALVGGYLAVARVVGERYAARRAPHGTFSPGWTAYRHLVYGLIGLLLIWVPAVLLRWVPVAGIILLVTAAVFTWVMVTTGFGAAILTRAGARPFGLSGERRAQLAPDQIWTAGVPARTESGRSGP
jgi:hypothetical protein